jgi:CBS domain-containing protein
MTMSKPSSERSVPRLCLCADTAADLMTPNPATLRADATVPEAIVFLAEHRYGGAPVVDATGQPVGVLSHADLVGRVGYVVARPDYFATADLNVRLEGDREIPCDQVDIAKLKVRDIMTPHLAAVAPETPIDQVVAKFLEQQVHRLFVMGSDGILMGVISFFDVLRHLQPPRPMSARAVRTTKAKPL